jgi:hypothetical protein
MLIGGLVAARYILTVNPLINMAVFGPNAANCVTNFSTIMDITGSVVYLGARRSWLLSQHDDIGCAAECSKYLRVKRNLLAAKK